jgi:hypothetical protein
VEEVQVSTPSQYPRNILAWSPGVGEEIVNLRLEIGPTLALYGIRQSRDCFLTHSAIHSFMLLLYTQCQLHTITGVLECSRYSSVLGDAAPDVAEEPLSKRTMKNRTKRKGDLLAKHE